VRKRIETLSNSGTCDETTKRMLMEEPGVRLCALLLRHIKWVLTGQFGSSLCHDSSGQEVATRGFSFSWCPRTYSIGIPVRRGCASTGAFVGIHGRTLWTNHPTPRGDWLSHPKLCAGGGGQAGVDKADWRSTRHLVPSPIPIQRRCPQKLN
jgi:hypothetical protein